MYKKAQSINEYVLVVALITIAGIGMLTYVKRGIQSNIKATADVLALSVKTGPDSPAPAKTGLAGLPDGNIDKKFWNPVAKAFYDNNSGFATAVKSGNDIYYYLTKDGVTTRIGGQDAVTGDFTSYDWEGYPVAVYDSAGTAKHLYERVEDPVTGEITLNEVEFIVKADKRDPKAPGIPVALKDSDGKSKNIQTGLGYDKYQILRLSSPPSEGEVAQLKGVAEPGLYKYDMPEETRLKVISNKSTTVKEYKQNKDLTESLFHLSAEKYKSINGGFIQGEIQGSKVNYYHFTTDIADKALVGAEDMVTRQYTEFGVDGFASGVANYAGDRYMADFTYNIDSETKEIISVTVKYGGKEVGTYGKYENIIINPLPPPPKIGNPLSSLINSPKRETIINNDTTTVTGAWSATYTLGTDIYKPKSDPNPKIKP